MISALSTLGARKTRFPARGLVQCNVHVDVIAWRRNRAFTGADAAIECLVGHLQARRERSADPDEPTGVLTHHLDMTDGGWAFVDALIGRARDNGAAWLDVRAAFEAANGAPLTSARSA